MQHRMKTHQLTAEQTVQVLERAVTGCLATVNQNGSPYVVPVHFVYYEGNIYIHGLPKGQKIDNIKRYPAVSMTVFEMNGLLLDPDGKPCDTNTSYSSAVISGRAALIDNLELKEKILKNIVVKYTPDLSERPLPENMVRGTAVIQISIDELTGKYY